jgi:hypothetical protein
MNTIDTRAGEGRKQADNGRNYLTGEGYHGLAPELVAHIAYSENISLDSKAVVYYLRKCN